MGCCAAGDTQDMAGQEILGAAEVAVGGARVLVARADEHVGGGDEQHVVLGGLALAGKRAAKERPEEGIQHGRHSIGGERGVQTAAGIGAAVLCGVDVWRVVWRWRRGNGVLSTMQ